MFFTIAVGVLMVAVGLLLAWAAIISIRSE